MIIGSIVAGYFTEYLHPNFCFAFEGSFGILVSINAFCLSKQIEEDDLTP